MAGFVPADVWAATEPGGGGCGVGAGGGGGGVFVGGGWGWVCARRGGGVWVRGLWGLKHPRRARFVAGAPPGEWVVCLLSVGRVENARDGLITPGPGEGGGGGLGFAVASCEDAGDVVEHVCCAGLVVAELFDESLLDDVDLLLCFVVDDA